MFLRPEIGDRQNNVLLASLEAGDGERLSPDLQDLDLDIRHRVFDAARSIDYVYFPHSCIISIHTRMQDGMAVEISAVGREGLVGLPVFLADGQTPSTAFCQVRGRSSRIGAAAFRAAALASPRMTALLLRYTQAVLTQVGQSAACNRIHSIEQRCARWLLTIHDGVDGDAFDLTQEFLGEMLGVRRPRVSVAAGLLQRAGVIRYSRGRVEIVDRAGLEDAACECYGVITGEYARLFNSETTRQ